MTSCHPCILCADEMSFARFSFFVKPLSFITKMTEQKKKTKAALQSGMKKVFTRNGEHWLVLCPETLRQIGGPMKKKKMINRQYLDTRPVKIDGVIRKDPLGKTKTEIFRNVVLIPHTLKEKKSILVWEPQKKSPHGDTFDDLPLGEVI